MSEQTITCPNENTLCVWCGQPFGDEICFNSKDICISCCIKAGDPCGHAMDSKIDEIHGPGAAAALNAAYADGSIFNDSKE